MSHYKFSVKVAARGVSACVLTLVAACTPASPAVGSPTLALWNRAIVGATANAMIYRGVIVFERALNVGAHSQTSTEAINLRTGKRLWQRTNAIPLSGSALFLAVGSAVERVDAHTGRAIWRSTPLCAWAGVPEYAAAIGNELYVGCSGGKLAALSLSSGRVLASAHPAVLDQYDQIVSLGHGMLGVGGEASGAYSFRQSAIIRGDTLSSVVVFPPDRRIIGARDGNALVDDACCQGAKSDSWPAVIERVSLATGKTISTVSLHPYSHPMPLDHDFPGPGTVLAVGSKLYVATHSALFVYDLTNLHVRPRMLYGDILDLPTLVDGRYLFLRQGAAGKVQRTVLLDAYANMRVIWSNSPGQWMLTYWRGSTLQLVNDGSGVSSVLLPIPQPKTFPVDASCMIAASNKHCAFMTCRNVDIASRVQLGSVPKCVSSGRQSICPGSVAVYALTTRVSALRRTTAQRR